MPPAPAPAGSSSRTPTTAGAAAPAATTTGGVVPYSQPKRSSSGRILKWIGIAIVGMIVMQGLVVLLAWLIIKPRPPTLVVEDGSVKGLSLSKDDYLNATFDISLRVSNVRNHRLSLDYGSTMEVSVWFGDRIMLGFDDRIFGGASFHQRRRNSTLVQAKPEARSLRLPRDVADQLNRQKTKRGEVKVDVRVKARLRFRMGGMFKTGVYHLNAFCSPVLLHLDEYPNKWFKRTPCHVHL